MYSAIHDLETNREVPDQIRQAWELLKGLTPEEAQYGVNVLSQACLERSRKVTVKGKE